MPWGALTKDEANTIQNLLAQIKELGGYSPEDLSSVHSLDQLENWILQKITSLGQAENQVFKGVLRYRVTEHLKQLSEVISKIKASKCASAGVMPLVPEVLETDKMTKARIASEYGISEEVITMLRAKRFLPDPYVQRGNSIYWLRADITPYLEAIKARSR